MTNNPRETPIERIFRQIMRRKMPVSIRGILLRKSSAKTRKTKVKTFELHIQTCWTHTTDFWSPKPEFPSNWVEIEIPELQTSATYKSFELMYRPDLITSGHSETGRYGVLKAHFWQ
jgi:hypothetical protein